jgi:DNA-binding response OmpR family regulator
MRRLLRLNLEIEHIPAVALASLRECLDWLGQRSAAVLVLDPCLLSDPDDVPALRVLARQHQMPILVVADGPQYRALARALDDAPYCSRPDRIEIVVAAVQNLMSGAPVPAVV